MRQTDAEGERVFSFPVVDGADGWAAERRGGGIFIRFKGSLRGTAGQDSAWRCIELMNDEPVCLICDLFELKTYESRVRTDWQELITPCARQFACFYAGATNPLVRMGVTAFGLFSGISVKVFSTRHALETALAEKFAAH